MRAFLFIARVAAPTFAAALHFLNHGPLLACLSADNCGYYQGLLRSEVRWAVGQMCTTPFEYNRFAIGGVPEYVNRTASTGNLFAFFSERHPRGTVVRSS
jgi:hypothetical protein